MKLGKHTFSQYNNKLVSFIIVTASQSNVIEILHGKREKREKVKQFDSAELKVNTIFKFSLFKFILNNFQFEL